MIRKTGGKSGGGSCLTDNAKKLVELYREFEKNVSLYADTEFIKLQNEMDKLDSIIHSYYVYFKLYFPYQTTSL